VSSTTVNFHGRVGTRASKTGTYSWRDDRGGNREEFRDCSAERALHPGGVAPRLAHLAVLSPWYLRTPACIGDPLAIVTSAARMSNEISARCIGSESATRTKTGDDDDVLDEPGKCF